jgi:hypothetical protein
MFVKTQEAALIARAASERIKGTCRPCWAQSVPLQQLLILALTLSLVLTGVSIAAMTLAQHAPAPFNPFAEFTDIFPGQPITAVAERGFTCADGQQHNYTQLEQVHCTLEMPTGHFSRIEAIVNRLYIQKVTFMLRGNTFRVGDLALLLGEPVNHALGQMVGFYSGEKFVLAFTSFESFSAFRPIWKVTFTNVSQRDCSQGLERWYTQQICHE